MDQYITLEEIEQAALQNLPQNARNYYSSAAANEQTLAENKDAFKRLRIRPKYLVGIANIDMSTRIMGEEVAIPIGISPSAMQKMAHPDGELANVKAAEKAGTIYILSTLATSSIEEVANAAPNAIKWFQVYIYAQREVTKNLIVRAEKAGFKAIVLTVDSPKFGLRRVEIKNKFTLPPHLRLANFEGNLSDEVCTTAEDGSSLQKYANSLYDETLTWEDVKWLKSITSLPIIAKGVLRADDALKAINAGCSGILVSNHGGRQLDGVPASIEALPDIIKATRNLNVEIYLDGGVREGTDVLKALALGAKMVFLGRPALWGLAVGGQKGVEKVLGILREELENAMQMAGVTSVRDIPKDMVVHQSVFSKL